MTHDELCHGIVELARSILTGLVSANKLDISCAVTSGPSFPAVLAIYTTRYGNYPVRFGSVMLSQNGSVTVTYDRSMANPEYGFTSDCMEVSNPAVSDWLLAKLTELVKMYQSRMPLETYELDDWQAL